MRPTHSRHGIRVREPRHATADATRYAGSPVVRHQSDHGDRHADLLRARRVCARSAGGGFHPRVPVHASVRRDGWRPTAPGRAAASADDSTASVPQRGDRVGFWRRDGTAGSDHARDDHSLPENAVLSGGRGGSDRAGAAGRAAQHPLALWRVVRGPGAAGRNRLRADLRRFLQTHIFDPLDMADTGYLVTDAKLERFSAFYTMTEGEGLTLIEAPD